MRLRRELHLLHAPRGVQQVLALHSQPFYPGRRRLSNRHNRLHRSPKPLVPPSPSPRLRNLHGRIIRRRRNHPTRPTEPIPAIRLDMVDSRDRLHGARMLHTRNRPSERPTPSPTNEHRIPQSNNRLPSFQIIPSLLPGRCCVRVRIHHLWLCGPPTNLRPLRGSAAGRAILLSHCPEHYESTRESPPGDSGG